MSAYYERDESVAAFLLSFDPAHRQASRRVECQPAPQDLAFSADMLEDQLKADRGAYDLKGAALYVGPPARL